MNWPLSSTSANRASSSERTEANWALTSTRGICCTVPHFSDVEEIRRHYENACNDQKFDVSERVVGVRVRRPERPSRAAQSEAEDGAADERENDELRERDAHDPCRDGHEGSEQRHRQADRDRPVVVAVEARLRPGELLLRDVDVAA